MKNSIHTLAVLPFVLAGCSESAHSPQATNPVASPDAAITEALADYVFIDGRVYTVNEAQPWAEAVAVSDNEIAYVGDVAVLATMMDGNFTYRDGL